MTSGEICAWYYQTRRPVLLRWKKAVIISIEESLVEPPKGLWLAPTLLDLQVNGYGGIDFERDDLSIEDLFNATQKLERDGCSGIMATLITASWPELICRVRKLRELRMQSPEIQSCIKGWHIEGPFLSPEAGYCGTHNPAWMCDPTASHVRELREAAGSDPLLITLAPERAGALDAIELAVSLGIKVSLGHTNAPMDVLQSAVRAGATGFTHLGNGIPQALDRHDNILWRIFETPGLTIGIIPDRIHVSKSLFRIIHRQIESSKIYYTTDAVHPAGMPPGRFILGGQELEVGADQVVRKPGQINFSGSALRPLEGVFRAAEMLDIPWQQAWAHCTSVPSHFIGLPDSLSPGQPASFCLLHFAPHSQSEKVEVYIRGQLRSELRASANQ